MAAEELMACGAICRTEVPEEYTHSPVAVVIYSMQDSRKWEEGLVKKPMIIGYLSRKVIVEIDQ